MGGENFDMATSAPPTSADEPVVSSGDSGDPGKSIILFSDGTGNSSAKLFKTNVWRMYEAVELGTTAVDPEQIVYYDEGVGNSGFRPLAILGGVFGWGLKRNVVDLYSFLCRNYAPGDRIHAFGFSRGAFTIRVLVGLIASQGVVRYVDERDLAHQAADAYRAYVRRHVPRFPPMRWLLPLWRMMVAAMLGLKRRVLRQRRYDRQANFHPGIRFVGLWDTVAAYGGPIIELVRAFDDWIRPLNFQDRSLPDSVDYGRHALSLDDERDAFQPVPWDEPMPTDRDRIKQVWFSGAHADVGGGYPDDSLAYVSLAWMMEEAQAAGLELRPEKVAETHRVANAFGPIHDPRAGLGAYYRYQPRIVGAYVEPPAPGTESMADPELADQGIDHCAWIHDSVLHRIAAGTDGYAPITLPRDFRVVDHRPSDSRFPPDLGRNLAATAAEREDRQETLRDAVWKRRVLYFLTVAASLGVATMPLWVDLWRVPFCEDSRCVAGPIISLLAFVLPGFAEYWIDAFAASPVLLAILVGLIVVFRILSSSLERKLRDGTRLVWRQALAGRIETGPRRTAIRALRTSPAYQAMLSFIKWQALPFLFGLAMLLLLVFAFLAAVAQVRLGWGEGRGLFECRDDAGSPANFRTAEPCNRMGVRVVRNETYEVRFHVLETWRDGDDPRNAADPLGIAAMDLRPWGAGPAGALLRRVIGARYLQPIVAIETDAYPAVHMMKLGLTRQRDGSYSGEFTAAADGRLNMFANDAVPAFGSPSYFYDGSPSAANRGSACVAISRREGDGLVPLVTCTPECLTNARGCRWSLNPKLVQRQRRAPTPAGPPAP
jgi:uncharacterized protein (DUF2235 family)